MCIRDSVKDMKLKLSTKMLGETLEQHCETEFNKLRATAFQKAYFEKDNDSKSVSYTHLRAHETVLDLVCRLLLEKKKKTNNMILTK